MRPASRLLLLFVAARKVRIGRAFKAMEENMQSIKTTFTCAVTGKTEGGRGFSIFWLMVLAIAILDDSDSRDKDRRRKPEAPSPATPKPG